MGERSVADNEALAESRWQTVPPTYPGLEVGTRRYTFQPEPCEIGEVECP
jgi:hypothetical protein